MATGAASQLAGACGVPAAAAPLLWLAVAQAAWIGGRAVARGRGRVPSPLAPGEPGARAGLLTVPLGLAVTTAGLAARHEALPSVLALAGLAVTWLSAVVFGLGFAAAAAGRHAAGGRGLADLDGSWFLAPAVLLGGAIATVSCLPQAVAAAALLRGLALTATAAGLAGYWAILAAAAVRIGRHGPGGAPAVLWWISAGCGGLAAAAAVRVLGAADGRWPPALDGGLRAAAALTLLAAAVVLVPVLALSIRFLAGKRPVMRPVPWPPAFSAGVIALGALGAGHALALPAVAVAGRAAGVATLTLWALTTAWNAAVLGRGLRGGRGGGASCRSGGTVLRT